MAEIIERNYDNPVSYRNIPAAVKRVSRGAIFAGVVITLII